MSQILSAVYNKEVESLQGAWGDSARLAGQWWNLLRLSLEIKWIVSNRYEVVYPLGYDDFSIILSKIVVLKS